eukprot:6187264-Pleurochrysis_carterae.AAC.13
MPVERATHQTRKLKVALHDATVRLYNVSIQSHNQRDCVLGHGVGRVCRHSEHNHVVLLRRLKINTIIASAAHGDAFNAEPSKLFDGLGA